MAVKIVCDSTAYIPEEWLSKWDIEVISLNVIFKDQSFKETELSNEAFYKKLEQYEGIPTSSQPSLEEMKTCFEKIVKTGDHLIGIFISSEMSGTYKSAHLVKSMVLEGYPDAKIGLIDSKTTCMEMGFVACVAAREAVAGKTFEEIYEKAQNMIQKSQFFFLPDTLEYLKRGGRIGSAKALLGSLLQIKPILTIKDGKTHLLESVRTKKKAVNRIVDMFYKDVEERGLGEVMVHHIHCSDEAENLANKMKEKLNIDEILIGSIGPVVGTHVGPGAIGIAYYTERA